MNNKTEPTELTLKEGMEKLFEEGEIPELNTQMDIWKVIESLGGYIFYTEHDAADGRISLSNEGEKRLQVARRVSTLLVNKLEEFGVISPYKYPECKTRQELPPAPKGKTHYWEWYETMNKEYYTGAYNRILCSACPFVEDDPIEIIQRRIPCSVFPGVAYHLIEPYCCAMIDMSSWDEKELYRQVQEEGGADVLKRFKQKIWTLKNKS